ncbi:phosphoglycerate mutase-like protein [Stereum hirsutum FP-91666 SS1]|uniref:phosphoglycerate mutase-like protein n=1 Tax=Stereum hirsutum (strain FP-91666) TaxID=721885 RepID=UPI000444A4BC|nr:phosphoglycerate mutase-like protein [Stereum hirsutum FP-91666 SS1]EIM82924.1 phosphoglycerate mutase-like protein [Stereum hirsutum FP-91666 SS1]
MSSKALLVNALFVSVAHLAFGRVHYPPNATNINDFEVALNGTGAPGIFNSSTTPDDVYGEYNWCNMPHVRSKEYKTPSKEFTLQYVEVIHRHHKRTPYASNTFFEETIPWSCDGEGPVYYGKASTPHTAHDVSEVQWQASYNTQNPFTTTVGPGFVNSTCQFPQITTEGLVDSHTHGADLRSVYASRLGLSSSIDYTTVGIRVTNNVITSQVAGALVSGLFPSVASSGTPVQALIESDNYDALEPAYSCPNAVSIMSNYESTIASWTGHLTAAAGLYKKLDAVSGIVSNDTAGWHTSFDHYYDNMSAKQCHSKSLPCSVNDTSLCVTQDEADTVYRLGNWEWSFYYRDAQNSTLYSALHYGAWILELKAHLEAKIAGGQYFHNVGHDGSIGPLLGFFQISKMVWPGMGSEVVFELYNKRSSAAHSSSTDGWYLRVLWGGQPMETSTPLGTLDMIPVQDVFDYIESWIGTGSELYNACNN